MRPRFWPFAAAMLIAAGTVTATPEVTYRRVLESQGSNVRPDALVIIRKADNPWIWNGVQDALATRDFDLKVKEIRRMIQYSILAFHIRFEECAGRDDGIMTFYDGGRWFIREDAELRCETGNRSVTER